MVSDWFIVNLVVVVEHVNREKKERRKDYAFRHQFNEKPSIIPGCPGDVNRHSIQKVASQASGFQLSEKAFVQGNKVVLQAKWVVITRGKERGAAKGNPDAVPAHVGSYIAHLMRHLSNVLL